MSRVGLGRVGSGRGKCRAREGGEIKQGTQFYFVGGIEEGSHPAPLEEKGLRFQV